MVPSFDASRLRNIRFARIVPSGSLLGLDTVSFHGLEVSAHHHHALAVHHEGEARDPGGTHDHEGQGGHGLGAWVR